MQVRKEKSTKYLYLYFENYGLPQDELREAAFSATGWGQVDPNSACFGLYSILNPLTHGIWLAPSVKLK